MAQSEGSQSSSSPLAPSSSSPMTTTMTTGMNRHHPGDGKKDGNEKKQGKQADSTLSTVRQQQQQQQQQQEVPAVLSTPPPVRSVHENVRRFQSSGSFESSRSKMTSPAANHYYQQQQQQQQQKQQRDQQQQPQQKQKQREQPYSSNFNPFPYGTNYPPSFPTYSGSGSTGGGEYSYNLVGCYTTSTTTTNNNQYHHHHLASAAAATPLITTTTTTMNNHQQQQLLSSGCTCKKSRCLKLYCQCFSASSTCGPKCKCDECHNTPQHADFIATARKGILNRNSAAFDNNVKTTAATTPVLPPRPSLPPPRHPNNTIAVPPRTPGMLWRSTLPIPQYTTNNSGSNNNSSDYRSLSSTPRGSSNLLPSQEHHHRAITTPFFQQTHLPPDHNKNKRISRQGCKCRRSSCLKKYCDCFQSSMVCGIHCGCVDCKNTSPSSFQPTNQQQVRHSMNHSQNAMYNNMLNVSKHYVPYLFSRHPINEWKRHSNKGQGSSSSHQSANNHSENDTTKNDVGKKDNTNSDLSTVPSNNSSSHHNTDDKKRDATQKYRTHEGIGGYFEEKKEDSIICHRTPRNSNDFSSTGTDRLAIMAALAMTELALNGSRSSPSTTADAYCSNQKNELMDDQCDKTGDEDNNGDNDNNTNNIKISPDDYRRVLIVEEDETIKEKTSMRTDYVERSAGPSATRQELMLVTPRQDDDDNIEDMDNKKRKSPEQLVTETACCHPLKKCKTSTDAESNMDKETGRHVKSSTSSHVSKMPVESRNPQPSSTVRSSPTQTPSYMPTNRFPWLEEGGTTAVSPGAPLTPRGHSYFYPGPPPMPMPSYHVQPPQSPLSYRAPYHPPSYYYRSPPSGMYRSCPSSEMRIHSSPLHPPSPNTNFVKDQGSESCCEGLIRTTGLPKPLSFRKICSRCGKTRCEHGELGFGNKCVFQDCGKCGAGYHWHELARQPMGILCQLKIKQGALPGAVEAYERKIRQLVDRAELQRAIQEKEKREIPRTNKDHPIISRPEQSQQDEKVLPPQNITSARNQSSSEVLPSPEHGKVRTSPTVTTGEPRTSDPVSNKDSTLQSANKKTMTTVATSLASLFSNKSPAVTKFLMQSSTSSLLEIKRTQSV